MDKRVKGIIFAALAGGLWGTYGTFTTMLYNYGLSEPLIANIAPIGLILFFGMSALIRNRKSLIPNKKQLLVYLIVGIVGVVGTNTFYAYAMGAGLSVGVASTITFTNYFVVMVAARIIWKTKITKAKIFAGIFSVIGILLTLQIWLDLSYSALGIIFIIIVTVTFAVSYLLQNFALNDCNSDPDAYFFWVNLLGFIIMLFMNPPGAIISEFSTCVATYGAPFVLTVIAYCIIPQVGNFFFCGRAFLCIDAPSVVIMYCIDPIVATILGFLVLGQSLALIQIVGIAIICASLIWMQLSEKKEAERELQAQT